MEAAIRNLNLAASSAEQTDILLETLDRVTRADGVLLILLRRDGTAGPPPGNSSPRLTGDAYEIVLRGSYPRILRVLVDLSRAPLVTRISTVSFERIRSRTNAWGEVQASLALATFSIKRRDVHA